MVKIVLFLDMNVKTFSQFAMSFDFTSAVLFACFVFCFLASGPFPFLTGEFCHTFLLLLSISRLC